MKKIISIVIALMLTITVFGGCRGGKTDGITIDPNRTQLYVYNYDGGVGSKWLDKVITRFESTYADRSFESGKKGVQVIPKKTKSGFSGLLQTSDNTVFFVQQAYYNELIQQGKVLDITDIVTEKVNGVSIEDRLTDSQKAAFTAIDGKYYILPHYVLYSGLTYDKDVFEEYRLYFNKAGNGFTNFELSYNEDFEKGNLSAGPDGIGGTYDDGLPSSFEEFYRLCTQMKKVGVIPFIYSGQYQAYSNHLINGLWVSYTGAEEFYYNFSFDSGNNEVSYVSGFNGDTPIFSKTKITAENGYYLNAQEGKYYALEFLKKAVDENWFDESRYDGTSHTDVHRSFVYSLPESKANPLKKPIAMVLEGTHWYNEAKEIISDAAKKYPLSKDRNFAVMPLPTRYDSTQECKKNTVCDSNSSFAFISSKAKNNPVALELGKLFLKFCYTEESLQEFTVTTGVTKGVRYELTSEQYNGLPTYLKSLYDVAYNSDIVYPYSDSPIFINNQSDFGFAQDTYFWKSGAYVIPIGAFSDANMSVKDYFSEWTKFETKRQEWNGSYSKYFGENK